jgi:SAM-dependent methyltransferase
MDFRLKQFFATKLIIARKIFGNWRARRRLHSGVLESTHGSTHGLLLQNIDSSVDYINLQFVDYLECSGLKSSQLAGMRVLELGFGDNVGVALRFVSAGAERVVCLDKFYSKQDPTYQTEIYRRLREDLTDAEKLRFDEAIELNSGCNLNSEKILCFYGSDLEDQPDVLRMKPFDLVISRSVIQEIYDPDKLFGAMNDILAKGGMMLHKIDLSDLGMFRKVGINPLTYLTIPEWIYDLMVKYSGEPNRKLLDYYRQKMNEFSYDAKILITGIIGVGDCGKGDLRPHKEHIKKNVDYPESTLDTIREIRPRLIRKFRELSNEELMVDGIFIVARKLA